MSNHTDKKSAARRSLPITVVGGLLVLASLIFLSWGCGSASSAPALPTTDPGAPLERSKGNQNARVVVEEWTDLQ